MLLCIPRLRAIPLVRISYASGSSALSVSFFQVDIMQLEYLVLLRLSMPAGPARALFGQLYISQLSARTPPLALCHVSATHSHCEALPFAFVLKNIGKLIWALSFNMSLIAMVFAFRRSPPAGVMTSISGLLIIAACTSSV